MKIEKDVVVTLIYQLSVYGQDNTLNLLESRDRNNPIEFIYGSGLLLPSIEKTLWHQVSGFKAELTLFPADAYGDFDSELEQWVSRDKFPKDLQLKVGMKFQTQGPKGDVISAIAKEIKDDQVLLDGNHPLAGLKIQFALEVLRVRAATEEELLSGEVKKLFH